MNPTSSTDGEWIDQIDEPEENIEARNELDRHREQFGEPEHDQPVAGDEPESDSSPLTPLERLGAATLDTAGLRLIQPSQPLIDGLLERDSLALIFGASGGSKTFFGVDLVMHIATGTWWNGCETSGGPGIYVMAEGGKAAGKRVAAWERHHGITYNPDRFDAIAWLTRPVNLFEPAWAGAFVEYCIPRQSAIIVIDTVARNSVGAEENSARDMGILIENADRVRRETHACVTLIHHTGKDAGAGARGSSALRAAVDTEIEVKGTDGRVTITVTKAKDSAPPQPWRFVRTTIDLGTDDRGKPVSSCVLVPDRGQAGDDLTRVTAQVLDVLIRIATPDGVSTATWREVATTADRPDSVGRSSFYEAVSKLVAGRLVQNIGGEKRPLYIPITPGQESAQA